MIGGAFGSRGTAIHATVAGNDRVDISGLVYDLTLQFLDLQAAQPTCTQDTSEHDKCVLKESCKQIKESIVPFCTNDYYPLNNVSLSEEEFKFYKKNYFSNEIREERCSIPCSFYNPALTSTVPPKEVVSLARNDKDWGSVNLTINYPKEVKTKMTYVYYTGINLISELGGWFGLLFGSSVFDLFCVFILTMNLTFKTHGLLRKSTLLKMIIALLCSSIVWWQLSVCLTKYLANPISTNIVIGKPDDFLGVSVTFCYKGFGYQGSGFDTFYSEEETINKFVGRLDFSFIKALDIQFIRSSKWVNYWNQGSTNDKELFKEFLEPYPDLLFCNSWEVPERISRLRISEANTKNLLIFVHGSGIFTIPGRRAALTQEAMAGIFVYNIGLEYSYSLSTEEHYCETDYSMYPDIRKAATIAKASNTNKKQPNSGIYQKVN